MRNGSLLVVRIGIALALSLIGFAGVVQAQSTGTTIASGFNSPQGVLVDPDGNVWVIDSGTGGDGEIPTVNVDTGEKGIAKYGDTARVVRIAPDGSQTVVATLPSILQGNEATGGARLALLNGTLYVTNGVWTGGSGADPLPKTAAVLKISGDQVTEFAQTWPIEKNQNPDGFIVETHPYGLTAGPDGNLWVADAGANDLLKINPSNGQIELVAVFRQGTPAPFSNPGRGGAMESDPVPTGVAFDRGGNIYVSMLPGAPFLPGSAKVVKLTPSGPVDYVTGLTMVTDLRTGPDGNLYAVQLGQFGEQGPAPSSGSIVRIKENGSAEVVLTGLSAPTSLAFNAAGDAYITINGAGAPGSGAVARYQGLTALPGTPITAAPVVRPAALPATGNTEGQNASLAIMLALCFLAMGLFIRRVKL